MCNVSARKGASKTLASIGALATDTAQKARSAGAWKARVLEVRANIYAAIRFGGVEAVGGPLDGPPPA